MLLSQGVHYFLPWQPKGWNANNHVVWYYVMSCSCNREEKNYEEKLSCPLGPCNSVRWLRCEVSCAVTGKFRGIPGVQALFNNKLWLLTCFVVIACCIPLNHVMPLIWIDWLWMIEVWNVVMAWNYARGNAIPGRGASAWNFGGFPSLAIRCVWSPKQKRFPEQFSALFAWWAFGGNHFKLIWPAPWWGLASLLWQQGVHKKGPKERRQTDQMVSRCYICLYMVQECSRFKRIRFTQRTFLGVSSLKVSMTSAGFLQIEQHYAAKPREKEEGEHIIHFSRQPGHAYFFDLTITYLKVACEVYGVPRLAALPNRFQRKQVPRIMLIAELQAQHVFPAVGFGYMIYPYISIYPFQLVSPATKLLSFRHSAWGMVFGQDV